MFSVPKCIRAPNLSMLPGIVIDTMWCNRKMPDFDFFNRVWYCIEVNPLQEEHALLQIEASELGIVIDVNLSHPWMHLHRWCYCVRNRAITSLWGAQKKICVTSLLNSTPSIWTKFKFSETSISFRGSLWGMDFHKGLNWTGNIDRRRRICRENIMFNDLHWVWEDVWF